MTNTNKTQRDLVDATGREIAQLKGALADAHGRLETQVSAIVKDADDEIAVLSAKAKAASGPAKQQLASAATALKDRRDALAAKAASIKNTVAADWSATKAELDVSLDELQQQRENNFM